MSAVTSVPDAHAPSRTIATPGLTLAAQPGDRRWPWMLVLAAAATGLLHVAPDIAFLAAHGKQAQGLHLLGAADESFYLTRVNAVLQGESAAGNAAILEHQNDPALMPALPERIEGRLGRALHLSIVSTDILCTFLYPSLLLLVAYAWLGSFASAAGPRLVAALMLALGTSWITVHPAALAAIWREGLPLAYVRPISPVWHVLVLLSALWGLFWTLDPDHSGSAPVRVVVAGILAGLVCYASVYVATAYLVVAGLIAASALLRGNGGDLARLAGIGAVISYVAIPAIFSGIQAREAAGFPDLWARYGVEFTRKPEAPAAMALGAGLVLAAFHPADARRRWWLIACVAAGWICLNQQVVTGKTLQPFHWQTNVLKPITLSAAALAFGTWLSATRWRWLARPLGWATVIALVAGSAVSQIRYYQVAAPRVLAHAEFAPVCEWLRNNAFSGDVVLTNPMELKDAELVTTYAGTPVYLSDPFFITSLLTRQEIEYRYLAALRFYGYDPDAAKELLHSAGGGGLFLGMQVFQGGDEGRLAYDRYLSVLLERYVAMLRRDPIVGLRPFRATLAYISNEDQERLSKHSPDVLGRLMPVFATPFGTLYRIAAPRV